MPLVATRGAASAQGFGEFAVTSTPTYIEDVFSTYLYTSDGTTQTITNGIDLSTYGGLVWIKNRSAAQNHYLSTTTLGIQNTLTSNNTGGLGVGSDIVHTVTTTGFTAPYNFNIGENLASWTFRKQPKFFDVVTYTGDGVSGRTVTHNLTVAPGFVIVKRTDATAGWACRERIATGYNLLLNSTVAGNTATTTDNGYIGACTATTIALTTGVTDANNVNASGGTYVAYLFAHDAGGFGLTGTDNVISCGSYTGNGSATGPVITLNYEPQWLMIKKSSSTGDWQILDNMRGIPVDSADATLQANLSDAESSVEYVSPTATGFQITSTNTEVNTNAATYIYMAIRRGPMKVPTDATTVFSPATSSATAGTPITTGFPIDLQIATERVGSTNNIFYDRLRGVSTTTTQSAQSLISNTNGAENSPTTAVRNWGSTGFEIDSRHASSSTIYENFRRAPSFFDEVCYTGTGVATTQTHNLGVVPELMIIKDRTASGYNWTVYSQPTGNNKILILNNTDASSVDGSFNNTTPTSSVFSIAGGYYVNASSNKYVAYLFATCAGVSKVGNYTGTGALQTVNCGFTSGARFVLIKRTDSTGDWWTYDSARGISSGNDPYLFLNSSAAEVTTTNYVDTDSTGFKVTAAAPAGLNANGGSYIFLAIS